MLIIKPSSDFKLLLTPIRAIRETRSRWVSNRVSLNSRLRYIIFVSIQKSMILLFSKQQSTILGRFFSTKCRTSFIKKIDQVSLLVVFFDQVLYSTYSRIRRKGFRRKVVHRFHPLPCKILRVVKIQQFAYKNLSQL